MNNPELTLKGTQYFQYQSLSKNVVVAYVLGALLGGLGIHRLYLKEYAGFALYMALFFMSFFIPVLFLCTLVFMLVDLFLTYKLCKDYNLAVYKAITEE